MSNIVAMPHEYRSKSTILDDLENTLYSAAIEEHGSDVGGWKAKIERARFEILLDIRDGLQRLGWALSDLNSKTPRQPPDDETTRPKKAEKQREVTAPKR